MISFDLVDAPMPQRVKIAVTNRRTGASTQVWAAGNLGVHVGDDLTAVRANRHGLQRALASHGAEQGIHWLTQVHGVQVHSVESVSHGARAAFEPDLEGDGHATRSTGLALAVQVADCLPIVLADKAGTWVAALHGGWRGMTSGGGSTIIHRALAQAPVPASQVLAWLGPCISAPHYEVDDPVYAAVHATLAASASGQDAVMRPVQGEARWLLDLRALARCILCQAGVPSVYASNECVYADAQKYYSHRRAVAEAGESREAIAAVTGRQAVVAWLSAR